MPVLLRKIAAILRRCDGQEAARLLHYRDLVLDLDGYTATREGRDLELTNREFECLRELIQHQGRVMTYQMLLNRIWNYDYLGDERVIYSHIKNLRHKLGADYIQTVRGVGYRSLTLRVFWLTFAFSVLACAITYGAIAGLTPLSYTALLKGELDAQAEALVHALEQGNAEAAPGLLQRFAQEKNAELRLTDRNGNIWFGTFFTENAAEAGAYEYAMESGDRWPRANRRRRRKATMPIRGAMRSPSQTDWRRN